MKDLELTSNLNKLGTSYKINHLMHSTLTNRTIPLTSKSLALTESGSSHTIV